MQVKARDYVRAYCRIILGAALYGCGFQFFSYPNDIVAGGVTGIGMIINYLTGVPVGVMTIIINIPLFIFAWKKFGLRYMTASLVGMLAASVFIDIFSLADFAATRQPLLAAVFGGMVQGLGLGTVYSVNASTGGTDIVAKVFRQKYQHINFSTFVLLLDAAIIAAYALIFDLYDSAMYSIISIYIATKAVDVVLLGAVNSKVCYIITAKSEETKDAIITGLGRGVTFLQGRGAYSGKAENVILCVIKSREIVSLKHLVRAIDPNAFMIVCGSHEIFGEGFTRISSDD
ncbi:MAG: YitT family protein [Oscillospiraceae bacterium]|nr:YitT family protein [Oscillospiraceae bacterium]